MCNKILFITTFPPRECGIATYSQDLINAINQKFKDSFEIEVCPIESKHEVHSYSNNKISVLNKDEPRSYNRLIYKINFDSRVKLVLIQHEFGLFENAESDFLHFLSEINKPIVMVFHTVLPKPNSNLFDLVGLICSYSSSVIVMTNTSAKLLVDDYLIDEGKIEVIPHGTHLVLNKNKSDLKNKYSLGSKKVLSTFGLLSSGKSIETTLHALPSVISTHPDVVFLIIGKTHPSVIIQEQEAYRNYLTQLVIDLNLENHVQFINQFLPLPELLDYLQLTDVYLFTSKDPNQAVSGTFAYAISCGCAVISTPIPHAIEVLKDETGIIIDFGHSVQLANGVNHFLSDQDKILQANSVGLHLMAATAWENVAIAHAKLFHKTIKIKNRLKFNMPELSLSHVENMTTDFGMIQFSKFNIPDIESGYTLDDNSRALLVMCQHYCLTKDSRALFYIKLYYDFIKYCLQDTGHFLNYIDVDYEFTNQNNETNLADSNGRAIWALGYLSNIQFEELPFGFIDDLDDTFTNAIKNITKIHSTRAMAFVIKGLYYRNKSKNNENELAILVEFSNRLVQMYRHEAEADWIWFESYLTYANSVLPEALLCAYLATGKLEYKEIAKSSFDFLLQKIFIEEEINVVSNINWLQKVDQYNFSKAGGEQPIDVAYTIIALEKFNKQFQHQDYDEKMTIAFNWFLGLNRLSQIVYNPSTGGCYDGLEEYAVNLNQGAESTLSYLLARLAMERVVIHINKMDSIRTLSTV